MSILDTAPNQLQVTFDSLISDDTRPTTSSSTDTDIDDWAAFFAMPPTPPVLETPDDIFSGTWSTPLDTSQLAPMMAHDSSSPSDFAFEPPAINKTPSTGYGYTPNTVNSYGLPLSGYSSASSFSSSSASGGASFSSSDALPAISRDFSRPSQQHAKRPATAGGALQSRSPFKNVLELEERSQQGDQNLFLTNPFNSSTNALQTEVIDPRYMPYNRRLSEGQGDMGPPSWPIQNAALTTTLAPQQISGNGHQQQLQSATQGYRPQQFQNRPQTSDGLPSFGGPTPLPSARSVVGSFSGFATTPVALQPPAQIRASYDESSLTSRERSDPRIAYLPNTGRSESDMTFVPIGGPAPKKRPRRRFDEIERLYRCGWSGCEKSYGTLNHLNAHVAMQKHGEKRLPSEFKDMRKAWRKKKREITAAHANGQYTDSSWGRSSMSSESDVDRRDSNISTMSAPSNGRFPTTTSSSYSYDSRPSTASSVDSSADGMSYRPQQNVPPFGYGQNMTSAIMPSSLQSRRDSAPQHVSMPSQSHTMGFRPNDDGPTPTAQNPYPLDFSINQNSAFSQGIPQQAQMMQMHQQQQQIQLPQHLLQHQHSQQQQQQQLSQSQRPGTGGFPFHTLTQPMPMSMAPQYGQFAFQR